MPGTQTGVFCLLAITQDCLEAGGDDLTALYRQRIEDLPFGSDERDALEENFYGAQWQLTYDVAGRITLPESLCRDTGLSQDVIIVGKGARFQIWDRERWNGRRAASRELARKVMTGAQA